MEHKEQDRVLAFDTLFSNNQIRMLKVVMPFLAPAMQQHLAVYIKYMELQYTLSYFRRYQFPPFSGSFDTHNLFGDILPYCSPEDKGKIKQMENLFSTMENYRNMLEMMSMMKEMFPDGGMPGGMFGGANGGFNADMFSGLFGGDTSGMFDLFQMFQNNKDTDKTNQNTTDSN